MTTLNIDASTLEGRFMACPREYYHYGILRRESCGPFTGRAFGRVMHKVLLAHYSGKKPSPDDISAMWQTECHDIQDGDYRNAGFASTVYDQYRATYPNEPFSVFGVEDIPVCELPFAFPLFCTSDTIINWSGIVDLVTKWPDGYWVMDHKTSSVAGETFWAQFQRSTAQLGYCWAVWKHFGIMPKGYIVNALFLRAPTRTGKGIEFARQKYPITEEDLSVWEWNTTEVVQRLLEARRDNIYPMHTNACVRRYGLCEYLEVCRLPQVEQLALLNSGMYRPVTWNPLAQP
jgi:hypothetical protein